MITLRNDFHNTSVNVRADVGDYLTDGQAARIARKLCPSTQHCSCGDELKMRGPQDDGVYIFCQRIY